jgi:hypothetical protein
MSTPIETPNVEALTIGQIKERIRDIVNPYVVRGFFASQRHQRRSG